MRDGSSDECQPKETSWSGLDALVYAVDPGIPMSAARLLPQDLNQ